MQVLVEKRGRLSTKISQQFSEANLFFPICILATRCRKNAQSKEFD